MQQLGTIGNEGSEEPKMDELEASSPDYHPDGRVEYWREMDELGKQHTLNQERYLIDRD